MTVVELINHLNNYPADMEILMVVEGDGYPIDGLEQGEGHLSNELWLVGGDLVEDGVQ